MPSRRLLVSKWAATRHVLVLKPEGSNTVQQSDRQLV